MPLPGSPHLCMGVGMLTLTGPLRWGHGAEWAHGMAWDIPISTVTLLPANHLPLLHPPAEGEGAAAALLHAGRRPWVAKT